MIRTFSPRRALLGAALLALVTMSCHRDRVLAPAQSEQSAELEVVRKVVTAVIPFECPANATKWTMATNGNWTDPARWSDGVPTAAIPACIDLPGNYVVSAGAVGATTPIPAQSLFLGAPGAASQPTLRVGRGILTTGGDAVVYGKVELAPNVGLGTGASTMISGKLLVAESGILTGGFGTSKQFEAATLENHGTVTAGTGFTLRVGTFANHKTLDVPANLAVPIHGPTSGGGPAITFEAGTVNAAGNLDVFGGSLTVTGGTVAGAIDLFGLDALTLESNTGGRFNVRAGATVKITKLTGTVAANQLVFIGSASIFGEIPTSLVNEGTIQINSSPGFGQSTVGLRTTGDGTLTNTAAGTITLFGTLGPSLEGSITNEGLIKNTDHAAIRADPLINRGTLTSSAGFQLNVLGMTAGAFPTVVFESGKVEGNGLLTIAGGELTVDGGIVTGIVRVNAPADVTLNHDTGGQFNLQANGTTKLNGVVGEKQTVIVGSANVVAEVSALTNHGKITINSSPGLGQTPAEMRVVADGSFTNAATGTFTLTGSLGPVLAGNVVNEGLITNGDHAAVRANPLRNHGTIRATQGFQFNIHGKTNNDPAIVILEDGVVDANGILTVFRGDVTVNGGTIDGTIVVGPPGDLKLHGNTGGRFNVVGAGITKVNGAIATNEHVFIGTASIAAEATDLVNNGLITISSSPGLQQTSAVLRTATGGKITNAAGATITMTGSLGPTLGGHVINHGLITNTNHAALATNPLVNHGTVRVGQGLQMNAATPATEPAPVFINEGGTLDILGTYNHTRGRFEHYDATVSTTGNITFNIVRFAGVGTWQRPLSLANNSVMAPGRSPGRIAITGNFTPSTLTVTQIELGGTEPGVGHDQIAVTGNAAFAGSLSVVLTGGFVPRPCQAFTVVTYASRTGTFANSATPIDVGGGMKLRQVYMANALVLVAYAANGPNVSPTELEVSVEGGTATYDVCVGVGGSTVTVQPPPEVTVDKTTLTFAAGGLPQTVTVSAVPTATRTPVLIKHTASSGVPVADVTVHITGIKPSDVDPPTTTATPDRAPNVHGWNNTDVKVTLDATDNEGGTGVAEIVWSLTGAQSGGATVSGNTASVTLTAEGQSTLTYFARDVAGNVESAKSLVIRIDKTRPEVNVTRTPTANIHGWNNSNLTATFSATDDLSGIDGSSSLDVVFEDEGANQSATRTFTDKAGNSASATIDGISIDKTAPTVTVTREPPANASGWNNTEVTATFSATDDLSGIDGGAVVQVVFTEDGANQSATRSFNDRAGNRASATITGVSIDRSPPTLSVSVTPGELWPPNHKMHDITVTVQAADASGSVEWVLVSVTSSEPDDGLGDGDTANDIQGWAFGTADVSGQLRAERSGRGPSRTYTLTYRATDLTGNSVTATATVRVPHDQRTERGK